MPAAAPLPTPQTTDALTALGVAVRRRRKALGISAVAAAEAAGISRPTLHRIEKGEASVTLGACLQVLTVLGLEVAVAPREARPQGGRPERPGWLPARVHVDDYPRLRELAWQVHAGAELTPREALDIYERNARHLDAAALTAGERDLVEALRLAFSTEASRSPPVV